MASNINNKFGKYAKLFEILSNPIRIAIIVSLKNGPKKPKEIRKELGIPQPLLSQHVSILRGAGIVEKVDRMNTKSACRLKNKTIINILKACGLREFDEDKEQNQENNHTL